ncbi:MAG: SCO1664 family protein [Dehalococcoidia bacterium]|nr:SCO1664 family protein [Dehalococcoidia bacterium]
MNGSVPRPNPWSPTDEAITEVLREATISELAEVFDSSNYVFLARLDHPARGTGLGIYKPARGERPLNDFPGGTLHRREVAAYELSKLLHWDVVPPTVECDGPHGEGSLQLYIPHDPAEHYFVLREDEALTDQLVTLAVFDLLANNADRKGGHVLCDAGRRIWAIDNGLCFHQQEKLRTVIWDFADTPIPQALLDDLRALQTCLEGAPAAEVQSLTKRLRPAERAALKERLRRLIEVPVLPAMYPWRCTPWPLI